MTEVAETGRWRQRRRTRKALLDAASAILKEGRKPSLEEVADAALVSRATAYRYFPSAEALLTEAVVDVAVPDADTVFATGAASDPVARMQQVDAALHDMILANEVALRLMMANSLQQRAEGADAGLPVRQGRRVPLIDAALAPARRQFRPSKLPMLQAALAIIVGPEGMVVCTDVLQLDDRTARDVKRWAIRALIQAARKPV